MNDVTLVRARHVHQRRTSRSLVVLATGARATVLRGTAIAVWEALAEPQTMRDLVAVLAASFGAPSTVVEHDVAPLVARLRHEGLVVPAAGATQP